MRRTGREPIRGGCLLLFIGAELLIRGAVSVARRLQVSPFLIGLTLVGYGTSTPELAASIDAALRGSSGIAVGNVVGSNIANILLILGLAAVISPLTTTPRALYRDGATMIGASVILVIACFIGEVGRLGALALLLLLGGYTTVSYRTERRTEDEGARLHRAEAETVSRAPTGPWLSIGFVGVGLSSLVFGASLLVRGAIGGALDFGVSETVIGLTVVAVGTSLPELVTSVVAALRGQSDVAFGNVVGSNIFNILGITAITAIVEPLVVPAEVVLFDVWVMLSAAILAVVFAVTGRTVRRWEGLALLLAYGAYNVILFWPAGRAALGVF